MDDLFPALHHRSVTSTAHQPASQSVRSTITGTYPESVSRETETRQASFRSSEHQPSSASGFFRHRPGFESVQASMTSTANESDARSYRSHSFSDTMSVHDVIEAYTDKLATKLNSHARYATSANKEASCTHGCSASYPTQPPSSRSDGDSAPFSSKTAILAVLVAVVAVVVVVYQLQHWTEQRYVHPRLMTDIHLFYQNSANQGQAVD